MQLNREQIVHLTNLVFEALMNDDDIDYTCDKEQLRKAIREVIEREMQIDLEMMNRAKQRAAKSGAMPDTAKFESLVLENYEREQDKRRNIR